MSQSVHPESNPDSWRWPGKFWVLILQLIKRGVNPGSVEFSLSWWGAGITCLSKRANIQKSLWQPHTHPHPGKVRGRRSVNPQHNNQPLLGSCEQLSRSSHLDESFLGMWNFADRLRDPVGSYVHMLDLNCAKPSTVYMLLFWGGFFFPTGLRIVAISDAVLLSHIFTLDGCSVPPVKADCVFCNVLRKRLLS